MFHELDLTLNELLLRELPSDLVPDVEISFARPDGDFSSLSRQKPAINFFLHDIQENRDLRSHEPRLERDAEGRVLRTPPPVRVDCHYLVTVWPSTMERPEQDEHRLLGEVLRALLRHREIPREALRGEGMRASTLPVRAAVLQPTQQHTRSELWQALGGKPKPAITYVVTIPFEERAPEPAGGVVMRVRLAPPSESGLEGLIGMEAPDAVRPVTIAGRLIDRVTRQPIGGAQVTITASTSSDFERGRELQALQHGAAWARLAARPDRARTAPDGCFHFAGLPDGSYTLSFTGPGGPRCYGTATQALEVRREEGRPVVTITTVELPPSGVRGRITDEQGNGVALARVRVEGGDEAAFSDATGAFYLTGVELGERALVITAAGFQPRRITGVSISEGSITEVEVDPLQP